MDEPLMNGENIDFEPPRFAILRTVLGQDVCYRKQEKFFIRP